MYVAYWNNNWKKIRGENDKSIWTQHQNKVSLSKPKVHGQIQVVLFHVYTGKRWMHFADVIFWTRDPQVYGHLLTLMHLKCIIQEENAVRYESCM